jgi:serine O-acetyltransferase
MLNELRADAARYPDGIRRALRCAGFYAVVVYRFGHAVYFEWPAWLRPVGKIFYKIVNFFTEWATGVAIAPDASIGPGLYMGHWGLTRVGSGVRMGAHCNLSPMVVIGVGAIGGTTGVPHFGDRVYIAAGAKIIGPIKIGSDVAIGANAVVVRDVPPGVTVGGVPAKIISRNGSAAFINVGREVEVLPAEDELAAG